MPAIVGPVLAARRRLVAIAIAVAAVVCAIAPAAQAYVIEGEPWPGATITYYPTVYRTAVDRAAKNWNDAKVGVKLKRVSSIYSANVVVRSGAQGCGGYSIVGYNPRHQSWVRLAPHCTRDLMTVVATHEFGHTLGLGHEYNHCARMNAVVDFDGTPEYCRPHTMSYWLKHALKGDDVHGARALYSSSFRKSSTRGVHALPSLVGNATVPAWETSDLPLFGDSELAAALTG